MYWHRIYAVPSRTIFCSWLGDILSRPIVLKCFLRSLGIAPNDPITTGTEVALFSTVFLFLSLNLVFADLFQFFLFYSAISLDCHVNYPYPLLLNHSTCPLSVSTVFHEAIATLRNCLMLPLTPTISRHFAIQLCGSESNAFL